MVHNGINSDIYIYTKGAMKFWRSEKDAMNSESNMNEAKKINE